MFPCPRSRLRIWSHEAGSAVPFRASPLILHTQAEFGAYSRDLVFPPIFRNVAASIPSIIPDIVNFTELSTDGIHRREPAGTGPVVLTVVLKVARLKGVAYSGNLEDQ